MSDSSSQSEDSDSSTDLSQDFLDSEDFGLQPYQFEPEIEISDSGESEDSEDEEDEEDHNRLRNSNWYVLNSTEMMFYCLCGLKS